MGNFRPYFILMLTFSSSYSNYIKVMMAIDITVTKYNLIHLNQAKIFPSQF